MRRIIAILLVLCAFGAPRSLAQDKTARFRFGAEWGLTAAFFNHHHFNYFEEHLGYRVNDCGEEFKFFPNACAELFAGVDIGRKWNLSMHGGIAGYYHDLFFPLKARATWTPSGADSDGWLYYAEAGPMFGRRTGGEADIAGCGGIGSGYRITLNGKAAIDLNLSLRATLSHPQIIDEDTGAPLSGKNIGRSNRVCTALSFCICLSF